MPFEIGGVCFDLASKRNSVKNQIVLIYGILNIRFILKGQMNMKDHRMADDMQINKMAILTGNSPEIIEKMMEMATDSEHILLIFNSPDVASKEASKKALERGELAGIIYSKNSKFVKICARVALNLPFNAPVPIKDGCLKLELSGKHLQRLLEKAEKYSSVLKEYLDREAFDNQQLHDPSTV